MCVKLTSPLNPVFNRQLAAGGHTVPTTIGEELETNPFMRVNVPAVAKAALPGAGKEQKVGALCTRQGVRVGGQTLLHLCLSLCLEFRLLAA